MPARVHLGWDRPPLAAAADWLAERGPDLGDRFVATPGARAARGLTQHLARRLGPAWTPPRTTTAGQLTDALLVFERPPADRMTRTLAWAGALRELPRRELERVVAEPPAEDDLAAWNRLASEIRALFGQLAAEGLDFRAVAEGPARQAQGVGELRRWEALAEAQVRMARALAAEGLSDPHLGRLEALERGRIEPPDARVVLVGVVELHGLLRRLLEQLEDVTALVFAPEERGDGFDAYGALLPAAWCERDLPLRTEQWLVGDDPADQAAQVERALAGWGGRYAAEEITVGVADPEVVPYLQRRLAAHGVAARDAAGIPFARTRPARLLAALARFVRRPHFAELAALVRHPDLERTLRGAEPLKRATPAEVLDDYHARHLPDRVRGQWLGDPDRERERARLEGLGALHAGVLGVLGDLAGDERRPAAAWSGAIRAALGRVYGGLALDREASEEDRVLAGALDAVGDALAALEAAPRALAPRAHAAEALELLVTELAGRAIAPRPAGREPTVELLGWLELVLDHAPALVVTGFAEGRVPESVHGDAWLPDHVRTALGLPDNAARLARDLVALEVLLGSREVIVVSGRRTADGDPLLPSRLAFHRPAAEIPARVRHALSGAGRRARPEAPAAGAPYVLPRREGRPPVPARWRVTAFRDYLASPYGFYLKHIVKAEAVDDRAREMDGRLVGVVAHDVLEDLGRSELRDATDERELEGYLRARLDVHAAARFGDDALPAVRLQLEQLGWRLGHYARVHAERARAGWRLVHAEWPTEPGREFELDVDGEPIVLRGRIDRIDHHPEHGWAILDYKTGDKSGEKTQLPLKKHRRKDGTWLDLQLPLYAWIAREVVGEEPPALGYVTLGKRPEDARVRLIEPAWTRADLDEAWERAREVVRAVRRGELFERGDGRLYDELEKAVFGVGLVGVQEEGP